CHGSGYYKTGINFEGPAPRPLERAKIAIDTADGQILIDKSVAFHQERGEWTHPDSFLKL
ncbi:MAG TPA: Rieske (2Fe-2S) protein, partial [Thermoanaerobaculia bacterium]|nr:Rieske (2Fe-2S) protein [Thermoanaerobaculia bacterium]